jgi:hypothetical protein
MTKLLYLSFQSSSIYHIHNFSRNKQCISKVTSTDQCEDHGSIWTGALLHWPMDHQILLLIARTLKNVRWFKIVHTVYICFHNNINVSWYFHRGRAWITLSGGKMGCPAGHLLLRREIKFFKRDMSDFCHLVCKRRYDIMQTVTYIMVFQFSNPLVKANTA